MVRLRRERFLDSEPQNYKNFAVVEQKLRTGKFPSGNHEKCQFLPGNILKET